MSAKRAMKQQMSVLKSVAVGRPIRFARLYEDKRSYMGPRHDTMREAVRCESVNMTRINSRQMLTTSGLRFYHTQGICVILIDDEMQARMSDEMPKMEMA